MEVATRSLVILIALDGPRREASGPAGWSEAILGSVAEQA